MAKIGQNQLLFSRLRSHKKLKKSIIAKWDKILLTQAGMDVSRYKIYSCRSASSCEVKISGLSLEEVLRNC